MTYIRNLPNSLPSLTALTALASLSLVPPFGIVPRVFEVPVMRLMEADFGDLLENELSDRERFERVESKISGFEVKPGRHGGVVLDIAGKPRPQRVKKSKGG
jgi:hypothetical protein